MPLDWIAREDALFESWCGSGDGCTLDEWREAEERRRATVSVFSEQAALAAQCHALLVPPPGIENLWRYQAGQVIPVRRSSVLEAIGFALGGPLGRLF